MASVSESAIHLVKLFIRDDDATDATTCDSGNEYDGRDNLRVLALFMILISSAIGSFLPILSSKYSFIRLPDWVWFIAKFFGSGVIIATGFIHLLEPASDALSDSCLTGPITEYPWAFGICLMSLFALFFSELVAHHYVEKAAQGSSEEAHTHSHFGNFGKVKDDEESSVFEEKPDPLVNDGSISQPKEETGRSIPGHNHYSHASEHQDPEVINTPVEKQALEQYMNQILSVFVLEFGILFHSVFIGLSLAVAGEEFNTLFIVLVFHQMFEGLGLGTRIAECPWDHSRRYTPWLLSLGFTLTTPIAVGIGIGVRHTYAPNSATALMTNGIFDSISAGILIYTGLVELMAHEFIYSTQFKGNFKLMFLAFFIMCWGAGLMALLGKWA